MVVRCDPRVARRKMDRKAYRRSLDDIISRCEAFLAPVGGEGNHIGMVVVVVEQ